MKNKEKAMEKGGSKNFQLAKAIMNDSSKLLNTLMSSMGDGLSIQDLDMKIVFQNKFMIDHFGEHIGEYCYKVYEKRETICEGCPMKESFETGKVSKAIITGITKDNIKVRFENIAAGLKSDEGQIIAGMELVRIVEDREKAIDELEKKNQELERFNKFTEGRDQALTQLQEKINHLKEKLRDK
jgi:hypothetical protein